VCRWLAERFFNQGLEASVEAKENKQSLRTQRSETIEREQEVEELQDEVARLQSQLERYMKKVGVMNAHQAWGARPKQSRSKRERTQQQQQQQEKAQEDKAHVLVYARTSKPQTDHQSKPALPSLTDTRVRSVGGSPSRSIRPKSAAPARKLSPQKQHSLSAARHGAYGLSNGRTKASTSPSKPTKASQEREAINAFLKRDDANTVRIDVYWSDEGADREGVDGSEEEVEKARRDGDRDREPLKRTRSKKKLTKAQSRKKLLRAAREEDKREHAFTTLAEETRRGRSRQEDVNPYGIDQAGRVVDNTAIRHPQVRPKPLASHARRKHPHKGPHGKPALKATHADQHLAFTEESKSESPSSSSSSPSEHTNNAAVLIQKRYRGYRARESVNGMRVEQHKQESGGRQEEGYAQEQFEM
jgi:hypothetical protein